MLLRSSICLQWRILSIPPSPPSGLVSEHEQMCWPKLRMRYRVSVIILDPRALLVSVWRTARRQVSEGFGVDNGPWHPVMAVSRALRFVNHVTKRNIEYIVYLCTYENTKFPFVLLNKMPPGGLTVMCNAHKTLTVLFIEFSLFIISH